MLAEGGERAQQQALTSVWANFFHERFRNTQIKTDTHLCRFSNFKSILHLPLLMNTVIQNAHIELIQSRSFCDYVVRNFASGFWSPLFSLFADLSNLSQIINWLFISIRNVCEQTKTVNCADDQRDREYTIRQCRVDRIAQNEWNIFKKTAFRLCTLYQNKYVEQNKAENTRWGKTHIIKRVRWHFDIYQHVLGILHLSLIEFRFSWRWPIIYA